MRYLLVIVFLIYSTSSLGNVSARKKELMNRRPGLVSKATNKKLTRAYQHMANNNYVEAISLLKKSAESAGKNNFAKAKVTQTLAYAYAQSEKYDEALKAFNEVLKLDALPMQPTLQSMFSLAQLLTMKERHKDALKIMGEWFQLTNKPTADAFVFAATLYHALDNQEQALKLVEKAISMTKSPKENWLVFAVSLHYQKKNYKVAEKYLYHLANLSSGKKVYWQQLAGALINQGKEIDASVIMSLAYKLGLLNNESEIMNIVSLYLTTDMPYYAAKLLKKSLDDGKVKKSKRSYELLANAYATARETEKAIAPLTKAAELSQDGKLFAYQGSLFLEQEQWTKALEAFDKAMQKGKLKKIGPVHVGKGVALLQLGKQEEARAQLNKALKFDEVKKQASQWLAYLN